MMEKMFNELPAQRVLHERDTVLVQQFCDGLHWHNVVLIGPELNGYYWEPLGSALGTRSLVRKAFDSAAPAGWTLESIPFQLQADGHSCGDWAHYFRCRVLDYVARDSFEMVTHTPEFPTFLLGEMRDLTPLKGSARVEAGRHQRRIARKRRDELRELLRFHAKLGLLEYGETLLTDFTPPGEATSTRNISDYDDAMWGDDKFHPIHLG
jgi:hypothetical protein